MPPGWDERYVTVFGSSYDDVGVEGMESMTTKLRSAGLPIETLPGPPILARRHVGLELTQRGRALAKAGVIGVREGATLRDAETLELLFDSVRRQVDPSAGGARAHDAAVGVHRPRRAHLASHGQQRLELRRSRASRHSPDVRLRVAYQDWVDIVGGRLDPLRAIATGKAAPAGQPGRDCAASQGLPARLSSAATGPARVPGRRRAGGSRALGSR